MPAALTGVSAPVTFAEEAEAPGLAMLVVGAQVPDAALALAPLSNRALGSDVAVVRAADPPHTELLPVIALCGMALPTVGLTPGIVTCVAPNAMPTDGT